MRKNIIIAIALVIVIGALFSASQAHKPKPMAPTTQEIWAKDGIPVETASIIRGNMDQTVEVTGDLSALESATLSSKISGRLVSVNVREGDTVSSGQVIAVLDQEDARSNLQNAEGALESAQARLSQAVTNAKVTKIQTQSSIDQAQASLDAAKSKMEVVKKPSRNQDRMVAENRVASAKANLDNAEANYKRYDSLLKRGAIAQSSFDVVKTQYLVAQADYKSAKEQLSLVVEGGRREDISAAQSQVDVAREQLRAAKANASQNMLRKEDIKSAEAGVRQARAAVAIARQQLENTYIKSPLSGVISSRTAEPGQVVSPGQAIATLVNLGSIYFKGDVSEKELANVTKGQLVQVQIDAIPGSHLQGTVTEIYPAGSTTSRNFSVRISIKQADRRIKPGMFARGEIITGIARNVILIPKDGVDDRKGTISTFTVGSNNIVKRHIINVVQENQNYAQVETPTDLKVGDIVVTQGRQNLQDGIKALVQHTK